MCALRMDSHFLILVCYTWAVRVMDNLPVLKSVTAGWNALAREQKISVGILGICGIVALGFSIQRINSNIFDPFTVTKAEVQNAAAVVDSIDPRERLLAESKRRDTDGDGISDYNEEKVLGTSPYLRDTDGDGSPDNTELALGQNPNCATGKNCVATQIDLSTLPTNEFFGQSLVKESSTDQLYAAMQRGVNDSKAQLNKNSTSTELQPTLVRDPIEIRKILVESGKFEASEIEAITDEQLLKAYDDALIQAASNKYEEASGQSITDTVPDSEVIDL